MKLWIYFIYKGTQKYWESALFSNSPPLLIYTSYCDKSELTSGFLDTTKKPYVSNEKIIYIYKIMILNEYKEMSNRTVKKH